MSDTDSEKVFISEFEKMNLDALRDQSFVVAVNTGERDKCKHLASTLHGPYNFYEMVEEVGMMFQDHQHHAKVTVLGKDRNEATVFLDENTTDYLEAHYQDIIVEGMLDGGFEGEYTCEATLITGREKKEESGEEESKDEVL